MTNKANHSLPGPERIARAELPNGIRLLVYEHFVTESVVITGSLRTGAIFDPPDKAGLNSFIASMLMRGTQSRDFDTLHESLESIGASLSVGGNMHSTSFGGKALAEDLPTLLSLAVDALSQPAFPSEQVERLRGEILTGLKIRQQDTRAVANELFRVLAYPPEHPYSRSISGEIETVSAFTLEDMRAFHARHYGPQGMILVVVGAVSSADVIRQAEDAFGGWENRDQAALPGLPPLSPMGEVRREFRYLPGKTQADLLIGWHGPSRYAPDYQAANLANNILGVFGMMGRLGQNVREAQGLAYYAGSRLRGGHGPGAWTASAGVNPANVHKAVESIRAEVARITTELVTEEELEDNKANFVGRLPLSLESNDGIAGSIYNMEAYGLGLDYLQRYRDIINAITRGDVQRAAQRYLSGEAFALAIAGPEPKTS